MVGTGYGAGVLEALRARGGSGETPMRACYIASPEDDPSRTLPSETLPLVLYPNLAEAVDAMLLR